MTQKFEALHANHTWDGVPLPSGKHAISCRWVYKIKHKADGIVERFKAWLVEKGYTQQPDINYIETFSPVVKMITVRALIATTIKKHWHISQLDVNNVFIHGDLHEEVYMQMSPGLEINSLGLVCKLNKSLYDLKHASRQCLSTPLNPNEKLRAKEGASLRDPTYYTKLVGKLNFLTNTRLDIAFSMQHLSQFMQDPREPHLKAAFYLVRYLKNDPTLGIFLSNDSDCSLKGYCDSDWAAFPDSRRQIDGREVIQCFHEEQVCTRGDGFSPRSRQQDFVYHLK
uniref:Reverse transcriptase Ty1/copia-type domain-containing protein n=1 Tax=Nicotiana tabacum TaxID=4097 RepID=A0A1S3YQN3_TOBAC|nr:PREDICTED: uncharacterized protein LOC107778521 [Nicotiana tabacum]